MKRVRVTLVLDAEAEPLDQPDLLEAIEAALEDGDILYPGDSVESVFVEDAPRRPETCTAPSGGSALEAFTVDTNESITTAALVHLCIARTLLAKAGARRSLARVRLAISSAKGAVRHAKHEGARRERAERRAARRAAQARQGKVEP